MSWALVADIGGTSCRLGRWEAEQLRNVIRVPTGPDLSNRIVTYIRHQEISPDAIVLAAAGVQSGSELTLTNNDATVDLALLQTQFPQTEISILNDFEAAAWAVGASSNSALTFLQGDTLQGGVRLAAGIGTGFGVGLWTGSDVLQTEGGHLAIYPHSDWEARVFQAVASMWPEVATGMGHGIEAEAILSGTGLPILHAAVCSIASGGTDFVPADEILRSAADGAPRAAATAAIFSSHLGRVLGDLFVVTWATGGLVLMGGVLCKNQWLIDDAFWSGLHAGGRYSENRRSVPLALWDSDDVGLLGAGQYTRRR
ncbi:MAG: glucokinase [Pseudomonadota bacterium]